MDAREYIQKIMDNSNIDYSLVKRKEDQTKIGIITFIQRDYLGHPDIGFAFLPAYCNKGYAYEATKAVMENLIETNHLSHILATTIPENLNSIKLLKKLGLSFEKEIEVNKVKLQVYGAATDEIDFG
jgi:RimJ/RimL family protein N-acetyltransferase